MELTAIFENWHIGDGNYPPLHVNQLVNLSFEVEPCSISVAVADESEQFVHLCSAEYRFPARVLKIYDDECNRKITVAESSGFRFYFISQQAHRYGPGDSLVIDGTLLIDHYIWVENLEGYSDAPNLFYNLKVRRIRKVDIPDRFIARHESGKSFPTRLRRSDYSESDVEDIETMEGQPFDEEFYIIDFDSKGLEDEVIARTFIG